MLVNFNLKSYTYLITKRLTKEPPHCTLLMQSSSSYTRVSFGSLSRVSKALHRLPSSRQGNRLGDVGAASVLDRIDAVRSRQAPTTVRSGVDGAETISDGERHRAGELPFEQSWLGLAPPLVENEQSYVGLPPCGGPCCSEMHSSLGPCTLVPSRECW
jgi:hypothetical protein